MSATQPLVSIIIPTFNRAHLIGETLDSVIAQTYTNWECIVVDDGSTDNTDALMAAYIAKDSRFQYHHRPKDRLPGGNAARNYGFEVSKGEYIQWFDSDDLMLPEYLEKKITSFSPNSFITICTGYSIDEKLYNRQLKKMPSITHLFKQYVLWQSKIMLPSIIFKRSFINGKSLFDEELLRGQENEFFSRLFFTLKPKDFVQIEGGLYLYRQHTKTKSVEDKSSYNSSFRRSMGLVSIYNLERGIHLKDIEIINYHYSLSIHYLFQAINETDKPLAKFFLQKLNCVLRSHYYTEFMQLRFWIPIFILMGRTVYQIEKRFKNSKLK